MAPDDGWLTAGWSSFASTQAEMTDSSGWSTTDGSDTFVLFVNNQATQDTQNAGQHGPEGRGCSVAYALVTYDTAPTGNECCGAPMQVTLNIGFCGHPGSPCTLYAGGTNDEYFLDVGYALATNGLSDYDPVLNDPANTPNPGLAQFDAYYSWRQTGAFSEEPSVADSLVLNGAIGDQVQVLLAVSSFSYSYLGYTWTDADLVATVTAASLPGDLDADGDVDLGDLAVFTSCTAGPGVSVPPGGCTPEEFGKADLACDLDVDLDDFAALQRTFRNAP